VATSSAHGAPVQQETEVNGKAECCRASLSLCLVVGLTLLFSSPWRKTNTATLKASIFQVFLAFFLVLLRACETRASPQISVPRDTVRSRSRGPRVLQRASTGSNSPQRFQFQLLPPTGAVSTHVSPASTPVHSPQSTQPSTAQDQASQQLFQVPKLTAEGVGSTVYGVRSGSQHHNVVPPSGYPSTAYGSPS